MKNNNQLSNKGRLIRTKTGQVARIYDRDGLINGKLPCYVIFNNETLTDINPETGRRLQLLVHEGTFQTIANID